jgi:diketogulonate reductase-like aldo/keto reductase
VATIPRSRDADHRRQNLDVFDFELDAEEMTRISALR